MKLNPRIFIPILAIAAGLTFSSGRAMAQAQPVSTNLPVSTKPATRETAEIRWASNRVKFRDDHGAQQRKRNADANFFVQP